MKRAVLAACLLSCFSWRVHGDYPVSDDHFPVLRAHAEYPESALRAGIDGKCIVRFAIDGGGRVNQLSELTCKPEGYFEQAVEMAITQFVYQPFIHRQHEPDSQPLPVRGMLEQFWFSPAEFRERSYRPKDHPHNRVRCSVETLDCTASQVTREDEPKPPPSIVNEIR